VAVSPDRPASSAALPATAHVGSVALTVRDIDTSRRFYEQVLGLHAQDSADGELLLGPPGGSGGPLLELRGDPSAPPLNRRATGLFHFAMLVPGRPELAHALARIAQARWPLDGASDHLVSEALYLSDPDGNGIEIYRDRPRSDWPHQDGQLQMATLPLDLDDLLGELQGVAQVDRAAPAASTMGHVHLQVSELQQIEAFYSEVLGFDVVVRSYPGALFVSAGGYHHHVGLNTWSSAGGSPPPAGAVGLRWYEIRVGTEADLQALQDRLAAADVAVEDTPRGPLVRDPSGNGILLRAD
jgi:catechol 2,3-dioxygenase